MKKYTILVALVTALIMLLIALPANAAEPTEPHPGNALWIEPSTTDVGGQPLGYKFNITLWINFTSIDPGNEVGAWQFMLVYEKDHINATRAGYTNGTMSQWFKDAGVGGTMPISPDIGSFNTTHNYVLHGETWISGSKASEGTYGSLSWIEFNITSIPAEITTGTFGFILTGVKRCKIMNEVATDVTGQFTFFTGIFIIPEFSWLPLILGTAVLTSMAVALTKKRILLKKR
jgi:hypothetical protein